MLTRDKYDKIYFRKIKEYNEKDERYTHYLDLGKFVMAVIWDGTWNYRLHKLEQEP